MKVYNPNHNEPLKPGLVRELAQFRLRRGFNPQDYIRAKTTLINDYLRKSGLKSVILGISGGIDSSVVAGLARNASLQDGSPIQKIAAVTIPAFNSAATGQSSAVNRALELADHLKLDRVTIDITKAHENLTNSVSTSLGIPGGEWARGQSVAHVRTAAISYVATLLSQNGTPGIILGTTNRDEGCYLGYVGKYSDGMVDLQVISDLHKSEVYAVARHLNLPASTINAIPTGDMYDNRADTEVFGAPYDFVELYENYLELAAEDKAALLSRLTPDEQAQFNAMAANLEKLHRYNAHKYTVGSPAYHLDVQQSAVPGGWQLGDFKKPLPRPESTKPFVGYFDLSPEFLKAVKAGNDRAVQVSVRDITVPGDVYPGKAQIFSDLLTTQEAQALVKETSEKNWVPVGDDGIKSHFDPEKDKVGSWRLTAYNPELAASLWERIAGRIPMTLTVPDGTDVDAQGAKVWRAVGVSPAFRFIKYDPAGENKLVTHYDGPFDFKDGRKTLGSMVLYLTDADPAMGGATRFIRDPQAQVPAQKRDLSDWKRPANDAEVFTEITPVQGMAAIFPHRILHDSSPLKKEEPEKIIIRTDIVYQKVLTP